MLALLACDLAVWRSRGKRPAVASAYGPSCSSTVVLQNLAETAVDVELEGHRSSGALVPLAGHAGRAGPPGSPGDQGSYPVADPGGGHRSLGPGAGAAARAAPAGSGQRDHGVPSGQPIAHGRARGQRILRGTPGSRAMSLSCAVAIVADQRCVSAAAVRASLCYSAGALFSVPGETPASRELKPVCSAAFEVQVPPFGTREFPVERQRRTPTSR